MSSPLIFQFGTSRFLQAHVDLFAEEARRSGQDVPGIVVVQTTTDAARRRRVEAFGRGQGFPVRVRGMSAEGLVDHIIMVTSVLSGMAAAADWSRLAESFVADAAYVVSNVGDVGYVTGPSPQAGLLSAPGAAPETFPAKLLALLHMRWRAGGDPVTMLPCELVPQNGSVLRSVVIGLAAVAAAPPAFMDWLAHRCIWVNTLVDRIVSEPLDPIGAVAEPYALWAIEATPGLELPFRHPAIVETDDLEPFERLKLHVLNLGHTWLADRWITAGRPAGATVRAALADSGTQAAIDRVYAEEVIPGFAARGLGGRATEYVGTALARFRNPFLDHALADIAQNHQEKIARRIGGFLDWVGEADAAPAMPELYALGNAREEMAA